MSPSISTNLLNADLVPSLGGPPHELFDLWRREDPVHWNPPTDSYQSPMPGALVRQGFWVLTRYQDVYSVSRNQELFTSHDGSPIIWDFEPPQLAIQQASLMGMQPANHAAVKRLVVPSFAPKELQDFYPQVDQLAKEIVDSVASKGECEFVFDVASKLPVYTFCTLMGIPESLHKTVFELGNAAADTENPNRSIQSQSAPMKLMEIAAQLTEQKRQSPDNSMLSRLIHGEVDGLSLIHI